MILSEGSSSLLMVRVTLSLSGGQTMHSWRNYFLVAFAALFLLACEDKNPLLGEWKLEKPQGHKLQAYNFAVMTGNESMRFEKDRMSSAKNVATVSYSVSGDEVTVRYNLSGLENTYTIIDGHYFLVEVPDVGTFKYVRAN